MASLLMPLRALNYFCKATRLVNLPADCDSNDGIIVALWSAQGTAVLLLAAKRGLHGVNPAPTRVSRASFLACTVHRINVETRTCRTGRLSVFLLNAIVYLEAARYFLGMMTTELR